MSCYYIPRYCNICNNLLPLPNADSDDMVCIYCYTPNKFPEGDRMVIEQIYNTSVQSMDESTLVALSKLPTTQTKYHDCPKCDSDIAAVIHDQNYKYNLVCTGCHAITSFGE